MNVYLLVPGTGNFFCGTCLRDYALARALRASGHSVKIVEMYLEHKVEGGESSDSPLFFGGINSYMQQRVPLFRHTPRAVDALFDAKPLIRFAATKTGMTDAHFLASMTISMLQGEAGNQFKELNRMVDWLALQSDRPDVVVLSNAMLSGVARKIKRELGCKVVCTLQGEDAFIEGLGSHAPEVWNLLNLNAEHIDHFVSVSKYYAEKMKNAMRLADEKVAVVYNGIEWDGFSPADELPTPPTIGFLSRMCPSKGLEELVNAYIKLRGTFGDLRLHVAGSQVNEDVAFVEKLKRTLANAGVENEVQWSPNLTRTEKQEFLRSISVLCTPARYDEAFGLYILEAWGSGVPVVLPNRGAVPELLRVIDGGIACDNLVDGLTRGLQELVDLRERVLVQQQQVTELFSADAMADRFLEVISAT